MDLTQDERTVLIEALREYRLRHGGSRQLLAEALVFRLSQDLIATEKESVLRK